MPSAQPVRDDPFGPSDTDLDYDVLIVGAGLSGILSLYRMRELGLKARVIEAGPAEGGTWFWYVVQHLWLYLQLITDTE